MSWIPLRTRERAGSSSVSFFPPHPPSSPAQLLLQFVEPTAIWLRLQILHKQMGKPRRGGEGESESELGIAAGELEPRQRKS